MLCKALGRFLRSSKKLTGRNPGTCSMPWIKRGRKQEARPSAERSDADPAFPRRGG
jgi:hypothetical protein